MVVGGPWASRALQVLGTGEHVTARWPDVIPLAGVTIDLGPLGAWFTLAAGLVIVAVAIYAIGYCDHDVAGRPAQGMFPLFAASLVLGPGRGERLDLSRAVGADGGDVARSRRDRAPRTQRRAERGRVVRRDDAGRVRRRAVRVEPGCGVGRGRVVRSHSGRRRTASPRPRRRSSSCSRSSASVRRPASCRCTCGSRARIRKRRVTYRRSCRARWSSSASTASCW